MQPIYNTGRRNIVTNNDVDVESDVQSHGLWFFMGRILSPKSFFWGILLGTPIYIAYGVAPIFYAGDSLYLEASESTIAQRVRQELEEQAKYFPTPDFTHSKTFAYFPNLLVEVDLRLDANRKSGIVQFIEKPQSASIRYDRIILVSGIAIIFAFAIYIQFPNVFRSLAIDDIRKSAFLPRASERLLPLADSSSDDGQTAFSFLVYELSSSELLAREIFLRSTLLLVGGILMAFIGVGIFYFTLPEIRDNDTAEKYGLFALRPTGVLIFIEAIAWFLLRQYRSLNEDYKWFHRIYLKRSNYVGALKILDKHEVRREDILLALTLIQEDLSGKLKKNETTEAIERLKTSEESPLVEMFRIISAIWGKTHGETKFYAKHADKSQE